LAPPRQCYWMCWIPHGKWTISVHPFFNYP